MKFSILVPAYNEERHISSCLCSLLSVAYPDKEIIVIDDASADHTAQVVDGFIGKGVILVRREKNGGRAAALNSGLQRATGDVIITTDADTVAPSDWLKRFELQFAQKNTVAVGGAYQACNTDKPLALTTSVLDQILNGIFRKSLVPNKLSGVNSAIRRNELLNLHGFHEHSWWSEDSELGWRLRKSGEIRYDPDNVVSTHYPDTWSGIWKRKYYWGYAMGLKFRGQMPFEIRLWARPVLFMALIVSLLAFFAGMPFGPKVYITPGLIFLLLLSPLTILCVPFGAMVMVKSKNTVSVKTLSLLAVLPLVREFAYVYGMFLGLCKGEAGRINPSWKENYSKRHK